MNTFIINSTINTIEGFSNYDIQERAKQTYETIDSIQDKVPDAKIILVDNSYKRLPEAMRFVLTYHTDLFIDIDNETTRDSTYHSYRKRGRGEMYQIMKALKEAREKELIGDRVFKISGRYKLSDSFNIHDYDNMIGKYVFKKREQSLKKYTEYYLPTRLWSFCGTLMDETEIMVERIWLDIGIVLPMI